MEIDRLSRNNKIQKTIITIFIFILIGFDTVFQPALGQDEIQRLRREINQSKKDTNRVWIYRDLAYYYLEENLDSALYFSELGIQLSKELGFIKGEIWNLYQMALAEEFMDRFEPSISTLKQAFDLAEAQHDTLSMAKLQNALGVNLYYQSNFSEAMSNYQEALFLSEKIGYQEGISYSLNNLGVIYRKRRNFKKALEIYERSLVIKIQENDTVGIINSRYNLGLLYSYSNKFEKSLEEFSQAERLSETKGKSPNMAEIKIGRGMALYNLEHLDEAEKYFTEGFGQLKADKIYEKIAAMAYLGIIEVRSGNPEEGMKKLLNANEMLENSERLELKRLVSREMARAYEILNQPVRAVEYWKSYNILNDSINNEQKHWAIEEMQAKYEALEKDKRIQMQELALSKEKLKKKRNTIILSLLFILTLASFFIYLNRWRKNNKPKDLIQILNGKSIDFEKVNQNLLSPITNREKEIIELVEKGFTNHEIAEKLFVSENTVKTHLKNIFSKTEALNRTDLVHRLKNY
ncbi:tetratricopeptide repeat protein [Shivajiella indica]|uniref:Tetratricopeptide repeat protein n=1 Tax=Shivajiella indica TaxID=872115 RepID=A0ABW5BCH9_9BACT